MTTETPRPRRRPALRILAIIGIVLLALAALSALSWALRTTERDSVSITDSYNRVEVDVSVGEVVIEAGEGDETTLGYRTESGLWREVEVNHQIEGDRLIIDADCGGFLRLPFGYCRADVTLTIPADVDVVARSSAGRVSASGLEGAADLESSAGRVDVRDHSGELRAHSSAGVVVVEGLASDDAEVSSSAGVVEVTAVEPPRNLVAESSAGDVRVILPDGAYALDADTSAGDVRIEVPTDPDSEYHVRVHSSAGDVTVTAG
jgi:Putative adhesin